MANFKRGKCRRNCPKALRGSETSRRAELGLKPTKDPDDYEYGSARCREVWPRWASFLRHWPAWWDREFHTKPHRAGNRRLERQVLNGRDPDDVAWPLRRKPHKYYW